MNRRYFLRSSGLALAAFGCGPIGPTGFLRRALAESPSPGRSGKVLVTLFLRGAADGLSLVAPTFESRYAALRPNLALKRAGQDGGALPLEGGFGLHPALAALHPLTATDPSPSCTPWARRTPPARTSTPRTSSSRVRRE